MSQVDIFKLDNLNIIVHIKHGSVETTTTHPISFNSIRSISVDNNRLLIYHGHQQSIFNIDGVIVEPEDMELS